MKKRLLIMAMTLFVILITVLFIIPEPAQDKLSTIKFGLTGTPDILDVPYFIAQEKGFFKDEGLDVEFVTIAAQGDVTTIQALLSGALDFGSSGFFSVLAAISEGADITGIVSVQNSHDYALVSHQSIKSLSDLQNKTIAIFAPGDITEIVTKAILIKNNVDPETVNWVSVGGSENRYRTVIAGKAQAAPLHSDLTYEILNEGPYHILSIISKEQPAPMSVVSTNNQFLIEHPDIVKRFVKSLIKASRYSMENKNGFVEVASKYLEGLDTEELGNLHNALVEQNIFAINGGLNPESLENGINLYHISTGLRQIPTIQQIVNLTFINQSVTELAK